MKNETPTVFVIDDDDAVRSSLRLLLKSYGLDAQLCASAEEFLANHDADRPGCMVLDVRMPGMSGIELQQQLNARGATIPIVFITGLNDARVGVNVMKAGAVDFLMKPFDESDLLIAVRSAIDKDRAKRELRAQTTQLQKRLATLTKREREVMLNVVAGHLNKQIAAELGIAEKTVKVHRQRVMEKMRAGSLAELVRLSYRAEAAPTS